MNKEIISHQPTGVLRILFWLLLWLYRVNLGWLLGKHFLMLTYIERKSGQLCHVVLEVMHHDVKTGAFLIEAGWHDKADWVNKLPADPVVQIKIGIQTFKATAVLTQLDEGGCYLLYLLPLPSNDIY
jgi:hypothetical protein